MKKVKNVEDYKKIIKENKEQIIWCIENKTDEIYSRTWKNSYIERLKEAYINMPQEIKKDAPKMEDKYSYRWSKWGWIDEKIAEGINNRYKENKTILHNVALDKERKDYVEAVVALIKMGANTTLRDIHGKTPIDYISENRINDVYQNLQKTLKRHKGKAVGLRVLRAIIEIEESKNFIGIIESKSDKNEYFEKLESFVKNNYKSKTKEDMENILSIHIFEDENKDLKAKREKYFTDKMAKNTKNIEFAQGIFRIEELDFEGLTNKNTKFEDHIKILNEIYNKHLLNFKNAYEENRIIRNHLMEDRDVKFRELQKDVLYSLRILRFVKDETVINYLETDIENKLKEHPAQVDIILNNKREVIEKIKNNLKMSVEDKFDSDIRLEDGIENTIKDIVNYINENHFNQILIKIFNIGKKGSFKDVQNFLRDYKEYLLENQPRSIKDSIDNLVKKVDILEEVININSKRLLDALVENGREINRYMLNGKLPIELAIDNNNKTMVEALLLLGAEIDLTTKNNITVLELLEEKMPDMCEFAKQQVVKNSLEKNEELESDKTNSKITEIKRVSTAKLTKLKITILLIK